MSVIIFSQGCQTSVTLTTLPCDTAVLAEHSAVASIAHSSAEHNSETHQQRNTIYTIQMATGINEGYESLHDMVDGEDANAHLTSGIPDYDEDLDEAFVGPYGAEVDESYDDSYEAESTGLIEQLQSRALESSGGDLRVDTHLL